MIYPKSRERCKNCEHLIEVIPIEDEPYYTCEIKEHGECDRK